MVGVADRRPWRRGTRSSGRAARAAPRAAGRCRGRRRASVEAPAAGQLEPRAPAAGARSGRAVAVRSSTTQRRVVQRGVERCSAHARAVEPRRQRGGERRRGVDHEQVARAQEAWSAAKRVCGDRAVRARRDEQRARPRAARARSVAGAISASAIVGHARAARELGCPVAAARQRALDQREQPGDAVLRRRPVGDVLARERLLVHLGAHVAWVDAVDAQPRVLGGEDAVS